MSSRSPRCAVIPARFASTRFPGKPLARLAGKPMIVHVLERVLAAAVFDDVRVATDDARIGAAVEAAGGRVQLTRADHTSGTDRVAEVALDLPSDAWIYNVQGDEPLLPPELLRDLVHFVETDAARQFATVAHRSDDALAFANPHVVKVVTDAAGRALYFSRTGIPHPSASTTDWLRHIGIYAFRHATLQRFVGLPRGVLEQREELEQLRALEHGIPIDVLVTTHATWGVDTPADLKAVAMRLETSLESQRPHSGAPSVSAHSAHEPRGEG